MHVYSFNLIHKFQVVMTLTLARNQSLQAQKKTNQKNVSKFTCQIWENAKEVTPNHFQVEIISRFGVLKCLKFLG
jgi:hypothetical protein